jgi:hypothetical protein
MLEVNFSINAKILLLKPGNTFKLLKEPLKS